MSWISRFSSEEITFQRIRAAFFRRLREIPYSMAWSLNTYPSRSNRARLRACQGIHSGHRCFIMGNGPSLAKMDLSPLKEEFTFGLNRIYLLFEKMDFVPTYYVAINELVLEQFSHEISRISTLKFLNWNRKQYFDFDDDSIRFIKTRFPLRDSFSTDITTPICVGATVTFVTLQIAYYMGFKEVILIGVDHSFTEKGTPNIVEVRKAKSDESHFAPDYFPKGVKWQLPDLRHSEIAYTLAREAFLQDGRMVLDATIGGKCPVFTKIGYESLF